MASSTCSGGAQCMHFEAALTPKALPTIGNCHTDMVELCDVSVLCTSTFTFVVVMATLFMATNVK